MTGGRTVFLALDGCHGTGTSTHADALAEALRAEHFAAAAFHHPRHPDGLSGLARVAWYAGARAQLAAHPPAPVVVMDRGPMSGVAHAASVTGRGKAEREDAALRDVWEWMRRGMRFAVLDAADEALDARLTSRGEAPAAAHPERRAWRAVATAVSRLELPDVVRFPVVDTGRPVDAVRAELLAWALGVLRERTGL